MLVRLGAADSVPEGRRIVRVQPAPRVRALPGGQASRPRPPREAEPQPESARVFEPAAYVDDARADVLHLQRACEAYRAAELIQPRPGLFLRVKA